MKKIYENPIVIERADPWIYKHIDGLYYFTGSVPGYQEIELRRSKDIEGLRDGKSKIIWKAPKQGPMSQLIWAPEIHYLNHKWYIYFAASDHSSIRDERHHHRMFVLENSHENPFEGEWCEKGQIKTFQDTFSLDGTVFKLDNKLYYVWAQNDPAIEGNSNLYLSEMENPWTLKGPTILLSIPEYDWEKKGFSVNEGPAALVTKDKVIITYSASATDENYAMGLLWADRDSDLFNEISWNKFSQPVFQTSIENQLFGPGHNSFTKNEDDTQDILVYHARPEINKGGDPLVNPNRHTHVKIFDWGEDGLPIFGIPE